MSTLGAWDPLPGFHLDFCRYAGAAARYGRHHHESSDLSVIVRGTVEERVGSSVTSGSSLFTSFKPAGLEHSDRFEGDVEILRLRISPAEIGEPLPARAWRRRRELGLSLHQLARATSSGSAPDDLQERITELLALLDCAEHDPSPAPAWMLRLEQSIEDRLTQSLRVRDLATEFGMHPVSLARVVRRVHGCSVRQLIIQKRLARAVELLRGSSRKLGDIATELGFADQAHLTRLLRRSSAFTPRALRRLGHRRG